MFKIILQKTLTVLKSTKKYFIAFACFILLFIVVKLFNYSTSPVKSDAAYKDAFHQSYKVFDIPISQTLNFADEKVPATDFSVREAMEKEFLINTYWPAQTMLLQKRANRWFPMIEAILKKNNIPDDFKYIALVESQLTNVVSPQGAAGFWQFVPPTAKSYGLEINDEVDERYDVEKSTEAACKYFAEAYKQFNSWTLVAASYNLGMTGVQAQLDKQKVKTFYDLLLTDETSRYIFRILSIKEIISRPKAYGYLLRKKDLYPVIPTKKIMVDSTIHNLTDFALAQNINYKILKLFNPWLRQNVLTNADKKKYTILIPPGTVNVYDWDGNYNGSDILSPMDSINLLFNFPTNQDTLIPKITPNK